MIALFMNLRAAFDTLDRGILMRVLRGRGLREGLVRRCRDVYRETKFRVRAGDELGKGFWTGREVEQECSLSPALFNKLVADLEEEMRKERWGGARLKGGKYSRWHMLMTWC